MPGTGILRPALDGATPRFDKQQWNNTPIQGGYQDRLAAKTVLPKVWMKTRQVLSCFAPLRETTEYLPHPTRPYQGLTGLDETK
jgi:hypothetical protein